MIYSFQEKLIKKESSLMWNHRIQVPIEISDKLYPPKTKEAKRVVCNINNTITIQIALTPSGNGTYYLTINATVRKQLKLQIGDTVLIQLSKDKSKYGIAFPKEMEELLQQDKEGETVFHSLTPGKQRTLLHLIGKPKSGNIRIRKAIAIIEYLKSVNGKLNFKELNEAIKNSNQ